MKVLLANPPSPWLRCRWDIKISNTSMKYFPFPVRLAYTTSVLKENGYDAHIIDATAEELNRGGFIKKFKKLDPDILIWETTASSFQHDKRTMEMLKEIKPTLKVVASGYHATPTFKEHLNVGYDYVIVGESDYSALDLVKYLNGDMKKFPKGVAANNKKLIPRPLIQNLDELPWPEREELPMEKYNDPKLKGFNVVLISGRGCPYKCSFCTVNVYNQKRNYRKRSVGDVVDEMEYLQNKYKPDEIYFDDDNFAVNEKYVIKLCEEILNRGINLKWNCMADARISDKVLKFMKKAGCTGVTIGAESADDNVLKHISKPITRKDIKKFVDSCNRYNLRSHVCWVLGLPHATKKSDLETIKFAINLPSDTLQFSTCVPYPGTEMYEWAKKNGYLTGNWEYFSGDGESVVDQPNYSHKEVEEMHKLALKMWHRKRLLKRPDIALFNLHNVYKYQGVKGAVENTIRELKEII